MWDSCGSIARTVPTLSSSSPSLTMAVNFVQAAQYQQQQLMYQAAKDLLQFGQPIQINEYQVRVERHLSQGQSPSTPSPRRLTQSRRWIRTRLSRQNRKARQWHHSTCIEAHASRTRVHARRCQKGNRHHGTHSRVYSTPSSLTMSSRDYSEIIPTSSRSSTQHGTALPLDSTKYSSSWSSVQVRFHVISFIFTF